MSEFNNRMDAQRSILRAVNNRAYTEELFGLSSAAIHRWIANNQLDPNSRLVELVKRSSKKLFFLANKSQEQVSPEYHKVSSEISGLRDEVASEVG